MPHSVTLEAGYTQKDLFFAAVRVQLEKFKETRDARILESPEVDDLTLTSADRTSARVTAFKNRMDKADVYVSWSEVRAQYPLKLNAEKKWAGDLSQFNKYQLANFLTAFTLQFQQDMTEFLADPEIKQFLETMTSEEVSAFILSTATILAHVITPSGGAVENDDARIIFSFCNIAANKFYEQTLMQPAPIGTLESCSEAMLNLISLTCTQPIGNEKTYGGMLGKAPRNVSGKTSSEYTPAMKMRDILEGYSELGSEVVAQAISNVSVASGHYVIPENSFTLREEWNDQEIFKYVLLHNLNFINQVNNIDVNEVFQGIILKRLWNAFFEDERRPEWLIDKKEIFLSMIEEKTFSAEFFENKVLSPGYTKLDIILAAIEEQIHLYGAEDLGNTNNARLFEAARVSRNEDHGLTVAMSLHDSTVVNQFEAVLAGALETEEWRNLREKYPIQVADRGKTNERYVIRERGFSREQCANYFFEFAVYFQKLWPEIESIINKSRPDLQVTKELICSIAIFLNTSLIPKTAIGEQNDELRSIIAFLSRLQNNIFKGEGLIESASVNDICENIKRFACLIVAKPIGDERSYEEIISKDFVESVFDSFPDYADEFKSLDPYSIPEEAFLFDSEESFFSAYYKSLSVYLDKIDGSLCGQALYEGVLETYWDKYLNDERCPVSIKEKKDTLKSETLSVDRLNEFIVLSIIEGNWLKFSEKIETINRSSEKNLESELLYFDKKIISEVAEKTKKLSANSILLVQNCTKDFMRFLWRKKSLNAQLFYQVLSQSSIFLRDTPLEGELSEVALEACTMLSLNNGERARMMFDLTALKGAVPSELQKNTMEALLIAFDNQYKEELLSALDEDREAPKYYNEHRIQYEIMNSLISLEFFSSQERILSILKSEINLPKKLSKISNIAKEKLESRSLFRSPKTVEFYRSLLCFSALSGLSDSNDVEKAFGVYLIARGDIPSNVIDIEHYTQRLFLREDQDPSFETRFMRWMKFSLATYEVIRKEDLHFGILATQLEVQHCYDAIMTHESLSASQKQAFVESLRTCCLINNGAADDVWDKIIKIPAVESEEEKGLLKLLQEYEASKENVDAAKPILSRIEMLCPRERLQELREAVEAKYPKRIIGHGFFGARAYESEVAEALALLKSDDRSIADILLGLENLLSSESFVRTRAHNVVRTFLRPPQRLLEEGFPPSPLGGRRF